jgi:hypothetical protein
MRKGKDQKRMHAPIAGGMGMPLAAAATVMLLRLAAGEATL